MCCRAQTRTRKPCKFPPTHRPTNRTTHALHACTLESPVWAVPSITAGLVRGDSGVTSPDKGGGQRLKFRVAGLHSLSESTLAQRAISIVLTLAWDIGASSIKSFAAPRGSMLDFSSKFFWRCAMRVSIKCIEARSLVSVFVQSSFDSNDLRTQASFVQMCVCMCIFMCVQCCTTP
jgi:hypothetical protein